MIDQNKAIALLGTGMGPTDVGTALGCDPSFISQMLMDEGTRSKVLALRAESLQAQTARDKKIDGIEDQLIEKLQDQVQYITKTRDLLSAFGVLNAAKRRGAQATSAINLTQNIVSINMPPAARDYFFPKTNAQGEVVQVGEQITTTKSLQELMADRTRAKLEDRKSTATDAQEISNASNPAREGERKQSATA
jgi:hypothetical protein